MAYYCLILGLITPLLVLILFKLENNLISLKKRSNIGYLLSVIVPISLICCSLFTYLSFYTVCFFMAYMLILIIGRVEYLFRKKQKDLELEQEKEFFHLYPDIEEKYKSALKVLDEKGKNFIVYRELTVALLGKTKELYFSRKKIIQDNQRISETINELEKVIKDSKIKNDKISMLEKRLEKARKKSNLYIKFINDTQEAIVSTIYDFVGIKADIELANSDTTKQIKLDNRALEEKSKTLSYLQEHLPVLDEENDNLELIDLNTSEGLSNQNEIESKKNSV